MNFKIKLKFLIKLFFLHDFKSRQKIGILRAQAALNKSSFLKGFQK